MAKGSTYLCDMDEYAGPSEEEEEDEPVEEVWLYIPVNPEPWAIGPVGYSRRGGKMSAYVGRNQQLHAFQEAVREELADKWGELPPLEGSLDISFWFWRQRAAYKTPQARTHRKHEADVTNLQKACEDALQGVVIKNDRDSHVVRSVLMEQGEHSLGRIVVRIKRTRKNLTGFEFDRMPPKVRSEFHSHEAREGADIVLQDNTWPPKDVPF